jgi:hypothetical protein
VIDVSCCEKADDAKLKIAADKLNCLKRFFCM